MDGAGQLLDVIRIHEQGIGELQSGSGEGAEDQDAVIIITRSDKLLGDEIHSVVQGSNHAQRSGAIEARDFLVRMMALEKDDGFPAACLKARIDALGFGGDLVEQCLVAINHGATGSAKLNEGEAALIGGVEF